MHLLGRNVPNLAYKTHGPFILTLHVLYAYILSNITISSYNRQSNDIYIFTSENEIVAKNNFSFLL